MKKLAFNVESITHSATVIGHLGIKWALEYHDGSIVAGDEDKEKEYRQVSNIRRTLVGNQIVDHSDVVGASPVGAAPATSSFST